MTYSPALRVSRRSFLKAAGVATMATGMGVHLLVPRQVKAQPKTLKILQ